MGEKNAIGVTPDQLEKLKKFGPTNLKTIQPVAAAQKNETPPVQPQLQVVQQVQPVANQEPQIVLDDENEKNSTYLRLTSKFADQTTMSTLEIDLNTIRERGVETRKVVFLLRGYTNVIDDEPVQQESFFNITSKEDFQIIKKFFSELNWED